MPDALSTVLVHGGAHGAWCWQPTIPFLDGAVLAVDLPPKAIRGVPSPDPLPPEIMTTTLDDFARSAIADVDAAGIDRFVLVGHSMGGLTIAEIARRVPDRVAHLVFVSCMVPPEGGLVADAVPAASREITRAIVEQDGHRDPTGVLALDESAIRFMFCNDMSEEQAQLVVDHTGTEAFAVFGEHVTRHGIPPELPKTYVHLAQDQALPPTDQAEAVERLRASPGGDVDVIELDTGHDVMISNPEALATVLRRITAGVAA